MIRNCCGHNIVDGLIGVIITINFNGSVATAGRRGSAKGLCIMAEAKSSRTKLYIHTLIMRMGAKEAEELLAAYQPLLVDAVPLTLEEIFIYELGGADYAVRDIVL